MSGTDSSPDADRRLGELLRAAGRRPEPSTEQLGRWRAQFEAELHGRRRRRALRLAGVFGACAAALLVAVLLFPGGAPLPAAAPVAQVVTALGGNVVRGRDGASTRLGAGASIAAGARVESGLYSGLGLVYRGADVRLDASTSVIVGAERLELVSGRVYVDTGPADTGSGSAATVRVETPYGWFEHVGTQFLVAVTDTSVVGAVREGRIVLHRGDDDLLLVAAADAARQVVVDDGGETEQSAVSSSGELWAWSEASSAGFELSGRNADDVLRWVARERGLRLDYASPAVRELAEQARIAGSGGRVGPEQALNVVVAATRLRVVPGDGSTLTVSLASEADQDAD
ncbi:MAG: hypothetical protein RIC56_18095 [Pseudomonadales bacterium]